MTAIQVYRNIDRTSKDKLLKVCEEFNLVSTTNKASVKKQLLKIIDDDRHTKSSYTQIDALFFLENNDLYWFDKKAANILKKENRDFVEYLGNFLYNRYGIEKLLKMSNIGYVDEYIVNAYKNCIIFLQDN